MKALCDDLLSECQALAGEVGGLSPEGWQVRTDFFGWRVYDEIAHLLLFDELGLIAASDRSVFRDEQAKLEARLAEGAEISALARAAYEGVPGAPLAARWEQSFCALAKRLERLDPRERLPWFGPDMSARSFATARLMETWAHGQDIYDALGIVRQPTHRLRHIAHLGVVTFQWSYAVRQMQPPEEAPSVELDMSGETWRWNEGSRSGSIQGQAQDFCLVVTQRRHPADTSLRMSSAVAQEWMRIAQCFAGPPEQGPQPGVRRTASRG